MVILDYRPLDLKISKGPEKSPNQYRASILENGEIAVSQYFELIRDLKLLQMLERIEEKAVIPKPQPEEITHIDFGKMLYKVVFSGELGKYFNKCLSEAQDNNCGLRISLQFDDDVPKIAALPWEYLHNGEDFLITRRSILLSRLPPNVKKKEAKPLNSILRMLVIISGPDDPTVLPLNTEKEQEIILEAVDNLQKEQKIKVDFTEDATFENVQGYLNEQEYHIVHFTGHGISINGKGYLAFETEKRKARLMDNKTLTDLFSDRGIRLLVLSSYESAKGSNKEAFGDLASMLSKRSIPAVVAMQYSVLDDVAIKFAYTFYRTIASGKSVDFALKEARIMMKNSEKSNCLDFATPVLYLSDCNCVRTGDIKPEPEEFTNKSMMPPELQVMKKGFIGRKNEIGLLEKGFRSDVKRAAIIHGFGGMGKTVLATRLALKMNEYFDGVFGMRCTPTTRPEDILNKINNFLMRKGIFNLNQPASLEVKTSMLVNILNQLRFLIIFDNFEDCLDEDRKDIENPELKAFIRHLLNNTISNTKFIITTRYDFDPLEDRLLEGIEHISLPELHFPYTNQLMNNYKELADLDISKKRQIYNITGGHPWTIGQFAKLSSVQGVDSLMLDLKPLKKELIEFTLLDKSFSKLDADAKKLILKASICEEAVPVEALSWIMGDDKEASPSIVEPLQKLIHWGLISKEPVYDEVVYNEHTIVRDFARERLEEERFDKKKLLLRAARYFENLTSQTRDIWDYLKARAYYFRAEDWERSSEITLDTFHDLISWGHVELAMNLLNESIKTTSGVTKIDLEISLGVTYQLLGDWNEALNIFNNSIVKFTNLGEYRAVPYTLKMMGAIHSDQGNYEEAMKLYNQSLKMEEEFGGDSTPAQTLQLIGMIHQCQGNYKEAMKLYNRSLELSKRSENKGAIAHTMYTLGNLNQDQGNYQAAINFYNQSLEIENELENKHGIAQVLHSLGMLYQRQGNIEEAVKHYRQSLEISKKLGNKNGIAHTLNYLGKVHFHQGNCKEAIKLYSESLEISKDLKDKTEIAQTLRYIGEVYYLQGAYQEATKSYKQSLKLEEELGNKSGIAQALRTLGNIHQNQENHEEALKLYNQSLNISKELGDKSGIAGVFYEIGVIFQNQGRYEEAINLYKRSLKDSEELREKSAVASVLHALGNVHYLLGDYEECTKLHNQALEISEILGDKSQSALILHNQGNICRDKGDYVNAVKLYNKSLMTSREIGEKRTIVKNLHSLGIIHMNEGNYEEALKNCNQSLKIIEEIGDKIGVAEILSNLGVIYKEKQEYGFSLQAYLKALSIFRELNSPYCQMVEKNISNMRAELGEKEFNAILTKWRVEND
ncbi:TPA: tetratricopeptide repeat protein [Methanosarcinaceae archaeon]|nr:tetratricopeptide repeat protein [Methanosarcinaceae archaeon]